MGGFTNCIHVKRDDAIEVADAVRAILENEGMIKTDDKPPADIMEAMQSPVREIVVFESHKGWVGLLNSDMMESESMALELSRRLATHVFQFMVHDSDVWYYALFNNGNKVDEFNSAGSMEEYLGMNTDDFEMPFDFSEEQIHEVMEKSEQEQRQREEFFRRKKEEMPEDLREIEKGMRKGKFNRDEQERLAEWLGNLRDEVFGQEMNIPENPPPANGEFFTEEELESNLERNRDKMNVTFTDKQWQSYKGMIKGFQKQMQDMEHRRQNAMSEDIRKIEEKFEKDEATQEESNRYLKWFANFSRKEMKEQKEDFFDVYYENHIDYLKPVLPQRVSNNQVMKVMKKESVFAEKTLAEFLQIFGIPPLFAHLSYYDFDKFPEEESGKSGVEVVERLKYKK